MTTDERIIHIKVLRKEVEVLTKRLKPNGTGHAAGKRRPPSYFGRNE